MVNQPNEKFAASGDYVLITPARNEQDFIETTILSVAGQSVPPRKWVIVSDGSSDGTDEIICEYSARYPFLQLLRTENRDDRNFSAKIAAFRAGCDMLEVDDYQFIGNLDADVSFAPDYFERLLERFHRRLDLGLAGGLILERIGGDFQPQDIHRNSVAGAVQMFRRSCFEAIGGYTPIKSGGVDAAAEIMARLHGWKVETFPDLPVLHHRRVCTGTGSIFATRFRQGTNHSLLGYHPLFQLLSSTYRLGEKPYLLGAMLVLAGYCWASLRYPRKVLPSQAVDFLRREQLQRISLLPREWTHRARTKPKASVSTGSVASSAPSTSSTEPRSGAISHS